MTSHVFIRLGVLHGLDGTGLLPSFFPETICTAQDVDHVQEYLLLKGVHVSAIHGSKSQVSPARKMLCHLAAGIRFWPFILVCALLFALFVV